MNQTTHPLVVRYLDDLDRLLRGIDPVERSEVVDGVREHLESSLAPDATDDDVRRVLEELGSPESVADEAYAGRPRQVARSGVTRPWLPIVAAVLQGLSTLVMAYFATRVPVLTSMQATAAGEPPAPAHREFESSGVMGVIAFVGASPFWVVMVVLVLVCVLWRVPEKLALIGFVPLSCVVIAVLPRIGNTVFGLDGAYAGARTACGLVLVAGALLIMVTTRCALRRTT